MPANYIFAAMFCRYNHDYIIVANRLTFPQQTEFYDYDNIESNDALVDNDFAEKNLQQSKSLCLKIYKKTKETYVRANIRQCDPTQYKKNVISMFSDYGSMMALVRQVMPEVNILKLSTQTRILERDILDIYDCQSVDFFLDKSMISNRDPRLLFTIDDPELSSADHIYIRFSPSSKYLYIITERTHLRIYELKEQEGSKIISKCSLSGTIPPEYEYILSTGINEEDISKSFIACKKKDFRNIDIFSIDFMLDYEKGRSQVLKSTLSKTENQNLFQKHNVQTLRIKTFDINTQTTRFNKDLTQVIHCSKEETFILELGDKKITSHQKELQHLEKKCPRQVGLFGEKDFLVATAYPQDSEISIRHTSDLTKKVKFYLRFAEGSVIIRDIISYNNTIKILVSRDDEEFVVYEIEDFKKVVFWQRFYECSFFAFEWPYVCYLNGTSHIIIQNAFNPKKSVFIKMKNLKEDEFVSHLFLSDSLQLYIVTCTQKQYLLYEKDLDRIMKLVLNEDKEIQNLQIQEENINDELVNEKIGQLFFKKQEDQPICRINKEQINNKSIYRFFIRSSSQKEIIQLNQERIIMFLCDFSIYQYQGTGDDGNIIKIDSAYKFRKINSNLVAYNSVDHRQKKANEIKYMSFSYSDFSKGVLYEEEEGKIDDFLVQEGQLLVLLKPLKESMNQSRTLKILTILPNFTTKIQSSFEVSDPQFIGNFLTTEAYANSMIPSQNTYYMIISTYKVPKIHFFSEVLPLLPGDQVQFNSPVFNQTYRKMMYFKVNKKALISKSCIILPYLNDNFIQFNKRTNVTQINNFFEYRQSKNLKKETNILTITPYTQTAYLYNIRGQLLINKSLKQTQKKYGEKTLCISPNAKIFLQAHDNNVEIQYLSLIKILPINISEQRDRITPKNVNNILKEMSIAPESPHYPQEDKTDIEITLVEPTIDLEEIIVKDQDYNNIKKFNLFEVINYYQLNGYEVVMKMNDNLDILIGFIYKNKTKIKQKLQTYVQELFLLKKMGKERNLYKIRLEKEKEIQLVEEIKSPMNSLRQSEKKSNLQQRFIDVRKNSNLFDDTIMKMKFLNDSFDFNIVDNKILVWSMYQIFHGDLSLVDSSTRTLYLKQSQFSVVPSFQNQEESQIVSITSMGQTEMDMNGGNFYIVIKIMMDKNYSFFIKYNILKEKEFSSFDCTPKAEPFFDNNKNGYILDQDVIIDLNQGIPLYYYRTGVRNLEMMYQIGKTLDKGFRFCKDKQNPSFLIRNQVFIPYSYHSLILIQTNKGQSINRENYDPDEFYCINGVTPLHNYASNFKNLTFILDQYEKVNPNLINMLLLKNQDDKNVLELAIETQSSRCVNLILEKLSQISMNNIHSVKQNFAELLEFNGFERYLSLCFFQTDQMKLRTVMRCNNFNEDEGYAIDTHPTCFLDKSFADKFQANENDKEIQARPIVIKSFDAGWIFKGQDGENFLLALAQSENMQYFQIDLIRILIMYQWSFFKPLIIKYLFLPFLVNFILFILYAILIFEKVRLTYVAEDWTSEDEFDRYHRIYSIVNYCTLSILVLFTIVTFYIEIKQMQFHRKQYFKSVWNLLDCSAAIITPAIALMDLSNSVEDIYVRPLIAVCVLIQFLKFFYFLRIFDCSAYFVRIIIEITYDIKIFLVVLFMGVSGFGICFYVLSNNNPTSLQFITSLPDSFIYSYQIIIGQFGVDNFSSSTNYFLIWVVFIMSTLFTLVVLLNMLVAIMGDSFARVTEQQDNQKFREHLQLIVENDFLVQNKRNLYKEIKYIIAIKHDKEESSQDPIIQQIQHLQESIKTKNKKNIKHIKAAQATQEKAFINMKKELTTIKNMIKAQDNRNENYFSNNKVSGYLNTDQSQSEIHDQ